MYTDQFTPSPNSGGDISSFTTILTFNVWLVTSTPLSDCSLNVVKISFLISSSSTAEVYSSTTFPDKLRFTGSRVISHHLPRDFSASPTHPCSTLTCLLVLAATLTRVAHNHCMSWTHTGSPRRWQSLGVDVLGLASRHDVQKGRGRKRVGGTKTTR